MHCVLEQPDHHERRDLLATLDALGRELTAP
jgi:hypothetical protein